MEVLLKKAKITISILRQCPIASLKQLTTFEILGYCNVYGRRWILLYNAETNELTKFILMKSVEPNGPPSRQKPEFVIRYFDESNPNHYVAENDAELAGWIEKILAVRDRAFAKGQFYI